MAVKALPTRFALPVGVAGATLRAQNRSLDVVTDWLFGVIARNKHEVVLVMFVVYGNAFFVSRHTAPEDGRAEMPRSAVEWGQADAARWLLARCRSAFGEGRHVIPIVAVVRRDAVGARLIGDVDVGALLVTAFAAPRAVMHVLSHHWVWAELARLVIR